MAEAYIKYIIINCQQQQQQQQQRWGIIIIIIMKIREINWENKKWLINSNDETKIESTDTILL